MATSINIMPGGPPAVASPRTSRRDILSAVGFSGLAAIAAAGFVRPDDAASATTSLNPDAAILAACAAFQAAHQEQAADNAKPGWDEEEINRLNDNWYISLAAVTASPRPRTEAGRIAMARAAHTALLDQITGNGTVGINEWASREEILALTALDMLQGAA